MEEKLGVDDLVKRVREDHETRRRERTTRATKTLKHTDVIAAWQRAYLAQDFEERVVTPTRKEVGTFLRHWKRFASGRDIGSLLMTICSRWGDLHFGPMSWHKSFPTEPNFWFVAQNLRFFIQGIGKLKSASRVNSVENPKHGRQRRNWKDVRDHE